MHNYNPALTRSLLTLSQFEVFALEVTEVSQIHAVSVFAAIKSMSIGMTSYVLDNLQRQKQQQEATLPAMDHWPFVTIPHFEAKGQLLMEDPRRSDWRSVVRNMAVVVNSHDKLVADASPI